MSAIRLNKSLDAWSTPEFKDVFKHQIEQLDRGFLPLQQGLSISSHVTDRSVQAMILNQSEDADLIHVKAGIFYTGIIAGCSCADDPAPIAEQNEYCVLQFCINKQSAEATVALVSE